MKNKYFCIMFYLHDYQFNERESDCLIVIGVSRFDNFTDRGARVRHPAGARALH